jgi:hypothetical protein
LLISESEAIERSKSVLAERYGSREIAGRRIATEQAESGWIVSFLLEDPEMMGGNYRVTVNGGDGAIVSVEGGL